MADGLKGSEKAKIKVRMKKTEMPKPESGGAPKKIKSSNAYRDTMQQYQKGKLVMYGERIDDRETAVRIAVRRAQRAMNRDLSAGERRLARDLSALRPRDPDSR